MATGSDASSEVPSSTHLIQNHCCLGHCARSRRTVGDFHPFLFFLWICANQACKPLVAVFPLKFFWLWATAFSQLLELHLGYREGWSSWFLLVSRNTLQGDHKNLSRSVFLPSYVVVRELSVLCCLHVSRLILRTTGLWRCEMIYPARMQTRSRLSKNIALFRLRQCQVKVG